MVSVPPAASGRTAFGLAFVALSTLMYEVLLTRIFSVTTWYHFAFVAISVAMFGMTVGALIVYLRPSWFPLERAPALAPWLWGINGATSVCASVIAVAIALHWGIAASFWTGVACYVTATVALATISMV